MRSFAVRILSYEVYRMSQKEAKVALGKLMLDLRQKSGVKMSRLSAKCSVCHPELHKLEDGRGVFPEDTVRCILAELSASEDNLATAEGYLKIIHPPVCKKRGALPAAVPSFVPAFA